MYQLSNVNYLEYYLLINVLIITAYLHIQYNEIKFKKYHNLVTVIIKW